MDLINYVENCKPGEFGRVESVLEDNSIYCST